MQTGVRGDGWIRQIANNRAAHAGRSQIMCDGVAKKGKPQAKQKDELDHENQGYLACKCVFTQGVHIQWSDRPTRYDAEARVRAISVARPTGESR